MQHSAVMEDASSIARSLLTRELGPGANSIVRTLERFGTGALAYARDRQVRIVPMLIGELYRKASPALDRLGVDVDAWPAPPAGLFVVEERTVYLRSRSPMAVAHEFGHALDCALGEGVYRSSVDPQVLRMFIDARSFVTPYAATAVDEYFAEGLRAYVEANDPLSHWPRATRARLEAIDPELFDYVSELFRTEFCQAA